MRAAIGTRVKLHVPEKGVTEQGYPDRKANDQPNIMFPKLASRFGLVSEEDPNTRSGKD
jgi:hypothetical protein